MGNPGAHTFSTEREAVAAELIPPILSAIEFLDQISLPQKEISK